MVYIMLLGAIILLCLTASSDTELTRRPHLGEKQIDDLTYRALIPDPAAGLNDGVMISWRLYARKPGLVNIQLWRRTGSQYEMTYRYPYQVTLCGEQEVEISDPINVKQGDVIGFESQPLGVIPYKERVGGLSTMHNPRTSGTALKIGDTLNFIAIGDTNITNRIYLLSPRIISGASLVGYELRDRTNVDTWINAMYISNFHPIKTGFVLQWEIYARRTGRIYMQVFRNVGLRKYKIVGQTIYDVKRVGRQQIDVTSPIPTQSGDVAGFYYPAAGIISFEAANCTSTIQKGLYIRSLPSSNVNVGSDFTFQQLMPSWSPCRKYSMRMIVATNLDA